MHTRKTILRWLARAGGAVVALLLAAAYHADLHGGELSYASVPFPFAYRQWAHVKSGVIGPEFPAYRTEGGIHHVYANSEALAGFSTGAFKDGSILVYDLLSLSEKNGVGTEGARLRIDVMVKDSKRYAATGGWGFGRFMGGDHDHDILTSDSAKTCYQCHQSKQAHGFVFSELRN